MSEATEESRTGREIPLSLLVLMFFASGAAGLIYETLWSRHLQLVFGSTTEAVSVVLATFMTGLGIGSYLFAARSGHTRRSGTSHPLNCFPSSTRCPRGSVPLRSCALERCSRLPQATCRRRYRCWNGFAISAGWKSARSGQKSRRRGECFRLQRPRSAMRSSKTSLRRSFGRKSFRPL